MFCKQSAVFFVAVLFCLSWLFCFLKRRSTADAADRGLRVFTRARSRASEPSVLNYLSQAVSYSFLAATNTAVELNRKLERVFFESFPKEAEADWIGRGALLYVSFRFVSSEISFSPVGLCVGRLRRAIYYTACRLLSSSRVLYVLYVLYVLFFKRGRVSASHLALALIDWLLLRKSKTKRERVVGWTNGWIDGWVR